MKDILANIQQLARVPKDLFIAELRNIKSKEMLTGLRSELIFKVIIKFKQTENLIPRTRLVIEGILSDIFICIQLLAEDPTDPEEQIKIICKVKASNNDIPTQILMTQEDHSQRFDDIKAYLISMNEQQCQSNKMIQSLNANIQTLQTTVTDLSAENKYLKRAIDELKTQSIHSESNIFKAPLLPPQQFNFNPQTPITQSTRSYAQASFARNSSHHHHHSTANSFGLQPPTIRFLHKLRSFAIFRISPAEGSTSLLIRRPMYSA
jgi:hypothetical protein